MRPCNRIMMLHNRQCLKQLVLRLQEILILTDLREGVYDLSSRLHIISKLIYLGLHGRLRAKVASPVRVFQRFEVVLPEITLEALEFN